MNANQLAGRPGSLAGRRSRGVVEPVRTDDARRRHAPGAVAVRVMRSVAGRGEYLRARSIGLNAALAAQRAAASAYATDVRTLAFLRESAIDEVVHDPGVPSVELTRRIDHALRELVGEYAAVTRQAPTTVRAAMERAHTFVTRFAATVEALEAGTITRRHADVILHAGERIDDAEQRAAYEELALDAARSRAPGQLDTYATRVAEAFMTESLDERAARACRDRAVWVDGHDDGTAELHAVGPALQVHAMHALLTAEADAVRRRAADEAAASGTRARDVEPRTVAQLRFDALAAHVLAADLPTAGPAFGALGNVRAEIAVTIPATALVADGRDSGDGDDSTRGVALLNGRTPVPVGPVRDALARAASFLRVSTDPITGVPVAVDRRMPTVRMRDLLRLRDGTCRFPGCSMPAARCQIDHTVAAEHGGPTSLDNLAHLCVGDHTLKHQSRMRVEQSGPGVLRWTTPTGRVVVVGPEPIALPVARPPRRRPPADPDVPPPTRTAAAVIRVRFGRPPERDLPRTAAGPAPPPDPAAPPPF